MLRSRTSLTLLIFLWICQIQAQEIFISSEIPVQVAVNGSLSTDENKTWRISLPDTGSIVLGVFSGDSISLEKNINPAALTYQFERSAKGSYRLFYRSNLVPSGETVDSDEWMPDSTKYFAIRIAPRLKEDVPDEFIDHYEHLDSLQPKVNIEPPIDEFSIALEQLSHISFEYERVQQIIAWGERHNPSTRQIVQLTELTTYDPSKLMILQQLYAHCIDPQNYPTLEDVLQFSSSKEAFKTWLSEWKELQ